METLHTKIVRGPLVNNSPGSYTVYNKHTDSFVDDVYIQKGPVQEEGVNGLFMEDMLLICIDQLEHFQASDFACQENADTLRHLRDALATTRARQYERSLRGVQGQNAK